MDSALIKIRTFHDHGLIVIHIPIEETDEPNPWEKSRRIR
ncbi:hypothetical protein DESC_480003 [Desulfosarcina cetonica]|nr:hypothetical protein DESC_480003 [Desulfosarcina cetonica]